MEGAQRWESYRRFKRFYILPLASEYIFALMKFIVDNCDSFQANLEVHKINTGIPHYSQCVPGNRRVELNCGN